jgi:hypothetical protein
VPDGALVKRRRTRSNICRKLRFHRASPTRDYGLTHEWARPGMSRSGPTAPARAIPARRLGRDPALRANRKELKGGEALTTNNRMELTAAIAALER